MHKSKQSSVIKKTKQNINSDRHVTIPSDSSLGSTEEDNEGLGFLNVPPPRHYLKTPGISKAHSTAFDFTVFKAL